MLCMLCGAHACSWFSADRDVCSLNAESASVLLLLTGNLYDGDIQILMWRFGAAAAAGAMACTQAVKYLAYNK